MTPYNDKCELKPYCDKNCIECKYFETVQQREEFVEAVKDFVDSFLDIFTPIAEGMYNVVKKIWGLIKTIYQYPNKRVINLALRHPKEKIRNKNINRIIKWLRRNNGNY